MRLVTKLFLFIFVLFLFSSLVKNILDYREKIKFYQGYKLDYEKEKKTNITLKTEALKKSDRREIEKTIRNKLNLLQPDEMAVILPQPTATPPIISLTPAPNWQKWWQVYFKSQ